MPVRARVRVVGSVGNAVLITVGHRPRVATGQGGEVTDPFRPAVYEISPYLIPSTPV
jgi:hypothetical protein